MGVFLCPGGTCVDHCEDGFFVDDESRECELCHRTCLTCGGPQYDDCDSCEDGFTLKSGECSSDRDLTPCPATHFRNGVEKYQMFSASASCPFLSDSL